MKYPSYFVGKRISFFFAFHSFFFIYFIHFHSFHSFSFISFIFFRISFHFIFSSPTIFSFAFWSAVFPSSCIRQSIVVWNRRGKKKKKRKINSCQMRRFTQTRGIVHQLLLKFFMRINHLYLKVGNTCRWFWAPFHVFVRTAFGSYPFFIRHLALALWRATNIVRADINHRFRSSPLLERV